MKKVLAISSVLLGVVFLTGCGQKPISQNQPIAPAPVAQTPLSNSTITTEEIIYTNTQYGFQLTFPKGWGNYKITTSKTGTENFINVNLPMVIVDKNLTPSSDSPRGYDAIFAIGIENISDWQEKCQKARKGNEPATMENTGLGFNDCTDNPPTELVGVKKLGMNDKYVFSINVNQNIPDEANAFICGSSSCDYDKFVKIIIDIASKGFKVQPANNQSAAITQESQIYKNDEYGFEFKYPKAWAIDKERTTANEVVFNIGLPESREAIQFTKNDEKLTLEQIKTKLVPNIHLIDKQLGITVNREKALYITTTEMGGDFIVFNHGKNTYKVTTGGRMIDEGILATFKFTK